MTVTVRILQAAGVQVNTIDLYTVFQKGPPTILPVTPAIIVRFLYFWHKHSQRNSAVNNSVFSHFA